MKARRAKTRKAEPRLMETGRMSGSDFGGVEGEIESWRDVRRSSREET